MKSTQKVMMISAAALVMLATVGCSDGGGDSSSAAAGSNSGANVAAAPTGPMFDYVKSLVTTSSETAEPVDISGLTISTSETAPPDGGS